MNARAKKLLAGLGAVAALSIPPSLYLHWQHRVIAPYLEADRQSEVTRQPGGDQPLGGAETLEENIKTYRDFLLFARNALTDGKPEYDLYVYKDANQMEIYDASGTLMRTMPVGTGKVQQDHKTRFGEYVTPVGEYLLINTFDHAALQAKFGRAAHNYGDGMLQLSGPWAPYIAIHGTDNSEKIGAYWSNGCVNVANPDVVWLISTVGIGSRVHIRANKPR